MVHAVSARWLAKKVSRGSVAFLSWASGSCYLRRVLGGTSVRIVTYHRFGKVDREPFCVRPEDFERHIRLIREQNRAVSLEDVTEFIAGRRKLPQDACLITVDDGMVSLLSEALPILQRWNVPAVAFVSSGLIGRKVPGTPERYLSWRELREISASGVITVGSHAHSHRSLGAMSPEESFEEALVSRLALEDKLGQPIASFAYPFGTRSDFNAQTDLILKDAGYSVAFNSVHGAVRQGVSPFSLPRVKMEGGEPLLMFDLISRGGLDAWRIVDNRLWRLQQGGRASDL